MVEHGKQNSDEGDSPESAAEKLADLLIEKGAIHDATVFPNADAAIRHFESLFNNKPKDDEGQNDRK